MKRSTLFSDTPVKFRQQPPMFEPLESRQLLSVSPITTVAPAAAASNAITANVKPGGGGGSGPSYSINNLRGYYTGTVSVDLGGVAISETVAVDLIPQNSHCLEVDGAVGGYTFDEYMQGSVNSKTGCFSFSAYGPGQTSFGAFSGQIFCAGGATVLTGCATVEFTINEGGDPAFVSINGNYQLLQDFPLPIPDPGGV